MSQPETTPTASSGDSLNWAKAVQAPRLRDLTGLTLGDFTVDRLLGKGGMGEVYLARQVSLNREVALKVLRPDLLTNPTYLARFEAEAWAAAKLNEPNIVHIYTLGSIDGIRFIAMEYVQGTNLKEFLQKKGPPELMLAFSIMRQAGAAIKAAGEVGLVHRDIKPENLLMTRKGLVKVADFGLCRDQDSAKPNVTQPGTTMGTPLYMSPEQAQGHDLDHRSDLYSLGVTCYHMLAGQPPFRGETALSIALKHVKDIPVDLAVHRPDLPPDLCRLVMKLMAKDPAGRYQSAGEMLRDLSKIREAVVAAGASAPGGAAGPIVSTPAITLSDFPEPTRSFSKEVSGVSGPAGRVPGWVWSIPAACLLVGAGLGWLLRAPDLLASSRKGPPTAPALWMAPDWGGVLKQAGPEQQYRYAQVQATAGLRESAWLAVPGYYPAAKEWSSRAYNQLARRLFRDRNAPRLRVFAAELAKMAREHDKQLGLIAQIGANVLEGDPQGVVSTFDDGFLGTFARPGKLTDPALAELALEITIEARRVSKLASNTTLQNSIQGIEIRLIQRTVGIMFADILERTLSF